MALIEDQSERRRVRVDNSLYSGWAYTRVFRGPVLSLETDIATRTIGRVLPVAEGGVSTSNLGDPRLASMKFRDKGTGGNVTIEETYISIDVSGSASAAFNLTTKTGSLTPGQHEVTKRIVGIAAATNSAGIPAVGMTDTGTTPTLIADYVVRSVQIIEKWAAGRVLVIAEAAKNNAESTVYT